MASSRLREPMSTCSQGVSPATEVQPVSARPSSASPAGALLAAEDDVTDLFWA